MKFWGSIFIDFFMLVLGFTLLTALSGGFGLFALALAIPSYGPFIGVALLLALVVDLIRIALHRKDPKYPKTSNVVKIIFIVGPILIISVFVYYRKPIGDRFFPVLKQNRIKQFMQVGYPQYLPPYAKLRASDGDENTPSFMLIYSCGNDDGNFYIYEYKYSTEEAMKGMASYPIADNKYAPVKTDQININGYSADYFETTYSDLIDYEIVWHTDKTIFLMKAATNLCSKMTKNEFLKTAQSIK